MIWQNGSICQLEDRNEMSNLGPVFFLSGLAHGQVDDSTMWRPDDTGYEYYISTLLEETMMSWHVARGLCMQNGGDLDIHTQ